MAIIRAPSSFPTTPTMTTKGVPVTKTAVLNAIPAGGGPPPTVGYPSS